jgi:hypothetical protein
MTGRRTRLVQWTRRLPFCLQSCVTVGAPLTSVVSRESFRSIWGFISHMGRITVIIVACAALFLSVCAIFWRPKRVAAPAKITVTFCGFTNEATGVRLASFRVSNLGGRGVFRWPAYSIEERGRVNPLTRGSCGGGCVLGPGRSSICLLPAPSNSAPWRAVFAFSDENWRRKLTDLPAWTRGVLPSRLWSLPVREGSSDWVGDISAVADAPYRSRVANIVVLSPSKAQSQTNAAAILRPAPKQ